MIEDKLWFELNTVAKLEISLILLSFKNNFIEVKLLFEIKAVKRH